MRNGDERGLAPSWVGEKKEEAVPRYNTSGDDAEMHGSARPEKGTVRPRTRQK